MSKKVGAKPEHLVAWLATMRPVSAEEQLKGFS